MSLQAQNKTFFPDDNHNREEMENSYRHVARTVENFTGKCKAELVVNSEVVDLPSPLGEILINAATILATWQPVTICPHEKLISFQDAADLLGVSRYTVAELCKKGELPYHVVNKYRKLYLADVIDYLNKSLKEEHRLTAPKVDAINLVRAFEEDPQKASDLVRQNRQDD